MIVETNPIASASPSRDHAPGLSSCRGSTHRLEGTCFAFSVSTWERRIRSARATAPESSHSGNIAGERLVRDGRKAEELSSGPPDALLVAVVRDNRKGDVWLKFWAVSQTWGSGNGTTWYESAFAPTLSGEYSHAERDPRESDLWQRSS